MKTKAIVLVIMATVVLLSFTVASRTSNKSKTETAKQQVKRIDVSGGLIAEDQNQWN